MIWQADISSCWPFCFVLYRSAPHKANLAGSFGSAYVWKPGLRWNMIYLHIPPATTLRTTPTWTSALSTSTLYSVLILCWAHFGPPWCHFYLFGDPDRRALSGVVLHSRWNADRPENCQKWRLSWHGDARKCWVFLLTTVVLALGGVRKGWVVW